MMEGVVFPLDSKGKRSTTGVSKSVLSTAIEQIDADCAAGILAEKNWRKEYIKHYYALTKSSVRTPESTLKVAQRGLNKLHESFEFIRDGRSLKLSEAMSQTKETPLTGAVYGKGGEADIEEGLAVPFENKTLSNDQLGALLQEKHEAGELEIDVVEAVKDLVSDAAEKVASLQDTVFVILGATSELCPLSILLKLGLNVAGVARPSEAKLGKLIQLALDAPEGASLSLPVLDQSVDEEELADPEKLAKVAGADILKFPAELKNWLVQLYPSKRLVIGSYIYLDGANHVRASVAMDAIISGVIRERANTALMYLGSPATVYPIPKEAHEDAIRRRSAGAWWHYLTPLKYLQIKPTDLESVNPLASNQSTEMIVFNGIINVQGPNYALAKTMQNWRAMVARDVNHCKVSVNMAPTCATDSVMHVPTVARAVRGLKALPPLTYFQPDTAKSLMALLMLYDMTFPESEANPETPLRNPMDLFASLGVHGGLWRSPYDVDSTGTVCYLADLLKIV